MSMYALDCEDKYATPMAQTGILVDLLRRMEGYFSLVLPIFIYTRTEWWNRIILDVGYEWGKHPLWVAQYKTKAPDVPKAWKTWTIWQYGQASGLLYGVDPLQNKLIDVNTWNPAVAFPWAEVAPKVTVTGTITINGVDYQLIKKE
jgi:hypothetical protein